MWTVHLEGGPRRVNHAAIVVPDRNRIYSFGGYCTGEDYETTRPMDVHILNTVTYQWKALPVPKKKDPQYDVTPYQRYGHSAVEYQSCAYIWGGRNDREGACNQIWCFNTDTEQWSHPVTQGPTPGGRDGHSACVINNIMYIFGGYEEDIDKFCNDILRFDFTSMTWSSLHIEGREGLLWRDFHSASVIGENMYVFGGRSDRGGPIFTNNEIYCNKIQVYNTRTRKWDTPATEGDLPVGRRSHSAFVYKGELYIFGGFNGRYFEHFGDMYKFNPVSYEWKHVKMFGVPPCPRRRQCCCILRDKVFFFGGTSPRPGMIGMGMLDHELLDHHDLHVLDLSPSLKTLCMMVVIEHHLNRECLPHDVRWEITNMTTNSNITRGQLSYG